MQEEKQNKKKKKSGLIRLFEIAGTKKWWLIGSMILGILATLAQFVPFVAVYLVIADLAEHAAYLSAVDRGYVFRLAWISLASVAVFGVFMYSSVMMSHIAAFTILYEIRIKLANKLSRLSMGFFNQRATGRIKKVMSEDVEEIELFVAHHIPDITCAVVFPLLVFAYLLYLDWRLALAAFIPLPLAFAVQISMFLSASAKESFRNHHDALESMNATVVEYVRGMPVVKIFNQSADAYERLRNTVESFSNYSKSFTKDYSRVYPAFLTVLSSSLVFYPAGSRVFPEQNTVI